MDKQVLDGLLYLMLNQSFKFDAVSYEIHETGRCIQHTTSCCTQVFAEYSESLGMIFRMKNNPTYLDDNFSLATDSDDLLEDRVQYGRLCPIDDFYGVQSTPIVCNIFPQKGVLRFATPNPLRIVEFSGKFIII